MLGEGKQRSLGHLRPIAPVQWILCDSTQGH